jgi:hypothetical protein
VAEGKPSLELHPCSDGEPYILGIFLTGAYQEILGDLHNLFGDTNAVHVRLTEQGYEITDLVHGDTVTEVLNYVQFRAQRPAGDLPPEGAAGVDLPRHRGVDRVQLRQGPPVRLIRREPAVSAKGASATDAPFAFHLPYKGRKPSASRP